MISPERLRLQRDRLRQERNLLLDAVVSIVTEIENTQDWQAALAYANDALRERVELAQRLLPLERDLP